MHRVSARLTLGWLALALAVVPAAAPAPASAQATAQTSAPATPPSCVEPTLATLWPAAPDAARAGLLIDEDHATVRVATIELDGAAPREAVLAIDSLVSELEDELGEPTSGILVFRCVLDAAPGARAGWTLLDRVDLEIDRGWDGTLDTRPGVVVLRAETLPGVGHDFARIEQLDVRGSYDPRFVSRRFVLVHVVGDEVVIAFDGVVRTETESGPDRATGPTTIRSIVYARTTPPGIRLRVSERSASGRTHRICSTTLRFDGREFVPDDPDCR